MVRLRIIFKGEILQISLCIVCLVFFPAAHAEGDYGSVLGGLLLFGLVIASFFGCVLYILYLIVRGERKRNIDLEITLIILENRILLSNEFYGSIRDIQEVYDTYMSSLGPWKKEEMIDLLVREFPDLEPSASKQVEALLTQKNNTVPLLFEH